MGANYGACEASPHIDSEPVCGALNCVNGERIVRHKRGTPVDLESFFEATIRRAIREELKVLLSSMPAQTVSPLLTISEAASSAHVASSTIRAWMKAGRLAHHGAGRMVRIKRSDLEYALTSPAKRPAPSQADLDRQADAALGRSK